MSDQTRAPQGDPAEPPLLLKGPAMQYPYVPSPKQLVFGYDPDQFEEFVKEWVPALHPEYVRVERQGGSGDHGIDVAAYRSAQGLEGPWDNYQCKRYKSALNWSTAAGEIRKMFAGVVLGHFVLPTQYVFVAPQFARLLRTALAKPAQTRAKFLEELAKTSDEVITRLTADQQQEVAQLAEQTDFAMFVPVDMDLMLEQHKTTPYWATRFPDEPRTRPAVELPPDEHDPEEARYVQQLVRVYAERWKADADTLELIAQHPTAGDHMRWQRQAFYSAESLRRFARDAYPEGHFNAVMDDVHTMAAVVAHKRFELGWDRLQAVLEAACVVALTETLLTQYVRPLDRMGVCHHLANNGRLKWCEEGGAA
ncbi:ABC-three component system protein [Streptomyces sp. NBC_00120]|uniref:ABC-three component system protein n=1 Tax=Streptomyces sp. NBC_00120 TaxID=2975660 RepID=UPI0022535534|nr:ABC-three component system protein [Streptomyces sp. NBC_00120]MCX5326341.1 restriction endonuclease [Streptomyces sp. NBC_00120]